MSDHFLTSAKAYVALAGSLVTALLGVYGPDTQFGHILTVASVLMTAFLTFQVPNRAAK